MPWGWDCDYDDWPQRRGAPDWFPKEVRGWRGWEKLQNRHCTPTLPACSTQHSKMQRLLHTRWSQQPGRRQRHNGHLERDEPGRGGGGAWKAVILTQILMGFDLTFFNLHPRLPSSSVPISALPVPWGNWNSGQDAIRKCRKFCLFFGRRLPGPGLLQSPSPSPRVPS